MARARLVERADGAAEARDRDRHLASAPKRSSAGAKAGQPAWCGCRRYRRWARPVPGKLRDLPRLRRWRAYAGRRSRIPAGAAASRCRRIDVGRRGVLSHPQRHQKHGDASLGHAGPADLATRRLYPSPPESGADGCRGASGERPRWAGACCDLCRLGRVQEMPRGNLRALEQIENGERGARSARASRRDHSRSLQARPARHFHQGRYRVRLRQPLEAALLHQDRRRLFPRAGAMGRHAQDVEEVFRPPTAPTGG